MFTGCIEKTATVSKVVRKGTGLTLTISSDIETQAGDSVAIDGCCLTVIEKDAGLVTFDVSAETRQKTHFDALKAGQQLNLERPLRLDAGLHGHLVSGHSDGVGEMVERGDSGRDDASEIMIVSLPVSSEPFIMEGGSIALNGVSLTVCGRETRTDEFLLKVCLIPETLRRTNLGKLLPHQKLNFEIDMIGKYIHHILKGHGCG